MQHDGDEVFEHGQRATTLVLALVVITRLRVIPQGHDLLGAPTLPALEERAAALHECHEGLYTLAVRPREDGLQPHIAVEQLAFALLVLA